MTAKEYLKQAYLLDKQIQVEVKELEQLREMRGTIQGCSYGEKIGTNPVSYTHLILAQSFALGGQANHL